MVLIGCMICTPNFLTNQMRRNKYTSEKLEAASHPLIQPDLGVIKKMKHPDSSSTKLDVLGVKLKVNEVEKFNFHILF